MRLDTEESELSDSPNEPVNPLDALVALVDETTPTQSREEINPMLKSKKRASKKKNKDKKFIQEVASLEMLSFY